MNILRNIFVLFRRYGSAMFLNMVGLVLAFCAFVLIMSRVQYENSFDKFHPAHENIFRVDQSDNTMFRSIFPPGFAEAVIRSSPHIEAGTVYCPFVGQEYMLVKDSLGQKHGFKFEVNLVSEGFFDVFGMELVEGSRDALSSPDCLVLPESTARKMFGNEAAIGKSIEIASASGFLNETDWKVGAVYKDLPENSQIRNNVFAPLPDFFLQNFRASNFLCYLRLDDKANASAVAAGFNAVFDFEAHPWLSDIELVPLEDVYFMEENSDGNIFRNGSRSQMLILVAIAVLILLTGTFNFTNFYTAMVPVRLRSINTRKVFGASVLRLRLELIAETVLLSLFACALSWLVLCLGFSVAADARLILFCLAVAVLSGLLAGVYPGIYATSFQPALVLKGNYGLTSAGKRLKNVLLGVQYAVSGALLMFVAVIFLQNRLLSRYNTGFDKDRIAVVELTPDMIAAKGEWLRQELRKFSEVEDVAYAMEMVGGKDTYCTEGVDWQGNTLSTYWIYCSNNFLDVMGIDVVDGQGFTESENPGIIMSMSARRDYGIRTGKLPDKQVDVIGFTEDVRFSSLRKDNVPICFVPVPIGNGYFSVAYIRLKAGFDAMTAVSHISETIAGIDPAFPFEVRFYDGILDDLYRKELDFRNVIFLFSLLAVVLSLTGIFAMVMFDTQYKRREIAVRKVFGASVADIVGRGNKAYVLMATVSFLVSAPLAWWTANVWLETFTVRIHVAWWIFLSVFVLLLLLTVAVVTLRFLKAASAPPENGLRCE